MLISKVEKIIINKKLMDKGAHIVLGLSGGPDSVCLFDMLEKLSHSWDWTIHVVHVNHKIRPGAAEKDAEYVKTLCMARKTDCQIIEVDCEKEALKYGITDEEAGRKIRYEAFIKKADEITLGGVPREQVKIAVAHNYNDQAETVMLRIIRGTGLDGLSGMNYERMTDAGYAIVRPMLAIKRSEIEEYCIENGLEPRTDETNLKAVYNRNRVRLLLLPEIDRLFGCKITDSLFRLAENSREDSSFINEEAEKIFEKAVVNLTDGPVSGRKESYRIVFDRTILRGVHNSVKKRVLLKGLKEIGLTQDVTRVQLQSAINLLESDSSSGRSIFPHGYEMKVSYEKAIFEKNTESWQAKEISECVLPKIRCRIVEMANGNSVSMQNCEEKYDGNTRHKECFSVSFDWDKICKAYENRYGYEPSADGSDIVIRYRETGDFMSIKAKKTDSAKEECDNEYDNVEFHRKKINRIFIDEKFPSEERDSIPILAIGSEALMIMAGSRRKNSRYKVDSGTIRVVMVEIIGQI